MQFSLSFGACPCSLHACSCFCLHPGVLQTLRVPLLSLARVIPQGVTNILRNGGSSAPSSSHPPRRCRGDPNSLHCRNQPSFVPHLGHICISCAFSFKAIHSFAFSSISPFPAEAVFITSANKLLTGACGGAKIKPPLISPLNNQNPSLTAVKTQV